MPGIKQKVLGSLKKNHTEDQYIFKIILYLYYNWSQIPTQPWQSHKPVSYYCWSQHQVNGEGCVIKGIQFKISVKSNMLIFYQMIIILNDNNNTVFTVWIQWTTCMDLQKHKMTRKHLGCRLEKPFPPNNQNCFLCSGSVLLAASRCPFLPALSLSHLLTCTCTASLALLSLPVLPRDPAPPTC